MTGQERCTNTTNTSSDQRDILLRTQEELNAAQERYFDLFELAPVGYITINNQGRILDANISASTLLGVPKEGLINQPLPRFIATEYQDIFYLQHKALFATRRKQTWEMQMLRADCIHVWAHFQGVPLHTGECRIAINDITESKLAEKALLESEARYRRITEDLTDYQVAVRVENGHGVEVIHGPGCLQVTGYSADEFRADPNLWRSMVTPEDRAPLARHIRRILTEKDIGQITPIEYGIVRKDGKLRWMSCKIIPFLDYFGVLLSYDAVIKDITERKQAEATNQALLRELENSETRFRSLVETATDAIVSIDAGGRITHWNNGAENLFGYAPDEVVGKNIALIIPPREQVAHQHALEHAFASGLLHQAGIPREVSAITKAGVEVPVEITVSRWQTKEGIFFTSIIRDCTKRKNQEEEKAKLQAQLYQAQKMEAIGILAGGIAHDFNNILAAIMGFTELAIHDAPPDSPFTEDLMKVLSASKRASDLVRQILAFSRQSNTDRILLQLQPLVKEVMKMLRASIPSTITIKEAVYTECGLVLADPTQVHQVLMNLCTNAYHAMEKTGGELSVVLRSAVIGADARQGAEQIAPGNYVELVVSDTGCGMGPDIIDNIFDPYFTTKEVGKGTGMGLAIANSIMQDYGGGIIVESRVGVGTAFHVYFPVTGQGASPEAAVTETVPSGSERILFVDDEKDLADMNKIRLERLGYTVTIGCSSMGALEIFRNAPDQFDLVITDQTMPDMTGADLSQHMLRIRPDIPIIMCTGYSNLIDEDSAKMIGIKEFAEKPLDKGVLARLIRKTLDGDSSFR